MNTQRSCTRYLVGALLLLWGLFVNTALPVGAQMPVSPQGAVWPPTPGTILEGGRWLFRQEFNDNGEGTLTIEVGTFLWDGFNLVPQGRVEQYLFPVACWSENGLVRIRNGVAVFDGNAYMACTFDLAAAFKQAGIAVLSASLWHDLFTMDVGVQQMANTSLAGEAPLFFHPDARFAVHPKNGQNTLSTTLNQYGAVATGNAPASARLSSRLDCLLDKRCKITHYVNGSPIGNTSLFNTPDGGIQISTAPVTIYIGYNPTTNTHFQGSLDFLEVDPPKITPLN